MKSNKNTSRGVNRKRRFFIEDEKDSKLYDEYLAKKEQRKQKEAYIKSQEQLNEKGKRIKQELEKMHSIVPKATVDSEAAIKRAEDKNTVYYDKIIAEYLINNNCDPGDSKITKIDDEHFLVKYADNNGQLHEQIFSKQELIKAQQEKDNDNDR